AGLQLDGPGNQVVRDVDGRDRGAHVRQQPAEIPLATPEVQRAAAPHIATGREEGRPVDEVAVVVRPRLDEVDEGAGTRVPGLLGIKLRRVHMLPAVRGYALSTANAG